MDNEQDYADLDRAELFVCEHQSLDRNVDLQIGALVEEAEHVVNETPALSTSPLLPQQRQKLPDGFNLPNNSSDMSQQSINRTQLAQFVAQQLRYPNESVAIEAYISAVMDKYDLAARPYLVKYDLAAGLEHQDLNQQHLGDTVIASGAGQQVTANNRAVGLRDWLQHQRSVSRGAAQSLGRSSSVLEHRQQPASTPRHLSIAASATLGAVVAHYRRADSSSHNITAEDLQFHIDEFIRVDQHSTGMLGVREATQFLSLVVGQAVEQSEVSAMLGPHLKEISLLQLLQKLLGKQWKIDQQPHRTLFAAAWWFIGRFTRPRAPAELRPMTLAELRQVRHEVQQRCVSEHWASTSSCKALSAGNTSLNDFAHYAILPETVPDGVLLSGLLEEQLEQWGAGTIISQRGADKRVVARGAVVQREQDLLKVQVLEGEFVGLEDKRGLQSEEMRVQICRCNQTKCGCCCAGSGGSTASAQVTVVHKNITLSWMEFVSGVGAKGRCPSYFVSHWWGHPIFSFVACCEDHAKLCCPRPDGLRDTQAEAQTSYWICAYAIDQHELEQISPDPKDTSFKHAIRDADRLESKTMPYTRNWCDFEIAKKGDVSIVKERVRILNSNEFSILKRSSNCGAIDLNT